MTHCKTRFHDKLKRPLIVAPTLSTKDVSQNPLTASSRGVPLCSNENCNVVAVTAEKKVDIVSICTRRSFC